MIRTPNVSSKVFASVASGVLSNRSWLANPKLKSFVLTEFTEKLWFAWSQVAFCPGFRNTLSMFLSFEGKMHTLPESKVVSHVLFGEDFTMNLVPKTLMVAFFVTT